MRSAGTRRVIAAGMVAALIVVGSALDSIAQSPAPATPTPNQPVSRPAPGTAQRRLVRPTTFPGGRPYAPAVRVGDALFLSGQIGRHPTTAAQPDGIAAQTRQALANIGEILKADGLGYQHLVKCHVYLSSMDDYAGMNQVYASVFTDRVPARTTVEAAGLPSDAAVQIACVAHAALDGIAVVRPAAGSLPAPLGPYSAAVWAGNTLYLSGMGGQQPADRRISDVLDEQVTQTLANIGTTLTAAGVGFGQIASTTAWITRSDEISGFAGALARPFAATPVPPTGVLFVPRLPGAIKAELTVVARRQPDRRRLHVPVVSAPEAGADVAAQFRAVAARLRRAVADGGLHWDDVADVHVYLADLADLGGVDTLFRELFPSQPARTVVRVRSAGTARIQVALVAAR